MGDVREIADLKDRRIRLDGTATYRSWSVSQVETKNKAREITITYCSDNKKVLAFNIDTGAPHPVPHLVLLNHTVMREGKDRVWRVASGRNNEATC